jgi:mediator of RNA polymerase II transcription subunit 21
MLEELSNMDRITQLQDEIQNASLSSFLFHSPPRNNSPRRRPQLLTIMSNSISYLTSRVNFVQVSEEIPVTKQRNPDKVDPPDVFEGMIFFTHSSVTLFFSYKRNETANKKELVNDLMMKAKQIEYLIQSLPTPEPEEVQVRPRKSLDPPPL